MAVNWIDLKDVRKPGWYLVRYRWDTHPLNNGAWLLDCYGWSDRIADQMIGIGPFSEKSDVEKLAKEPAWNGDGPGWPALAETGGTNRKEPT